jgi:hypothetical protein
MHICRDIGIGSDEGMSCISQLTCHTPTPNNPPLLLHLPHHPFHTHTFTGEAGASIMLSSRKGEDLAVACKDLRAAGITAEYIAADCR